MLIFYGLKSEVGLREYRRPLKMALDSQKPSILSIVNKGVTKLIVNASTKGKEIDLKPEQLLQCPRSG
jgi:hypothetical protein